MAEQTTTIESPKTNRVYYNYGDQQIDLKHYIHNLNSNINRFLATKFDWDSTQKDAFRNKVVELCSGLQQQLNTKGSRFSTDYNGILHDSDSNFNYQSDIVSSINNDGSTGQSIDLNAELNDYANLIGGTIAIKGYNKDYYDALDKQKEEKERKAKAIAANKAKVASGEDVSTTNPDGTSKTKYNQDLQGFLAYLKAQDQLYNKDDNTFRWDDIYRLDNSEDTTERNKFLAQALQDYTKALSDTTLDFDGSKYGSQQGYLDALKKAYDALNDGYNYDNDKEALNNIGLDDEFLKEWFKSGSDTAGISTEGSSIQENFLEKLQEINVDLSKAYTQQSSLQINEPKFKEIGDTNAHSIASKDAQGKSTSKSSSDAAKMINALNQLASYIGTNVPQVKNREATTKWINDREAELIQLLKTKNTQKAKTLAEGLVAFNNIFKKVYGSGIFISDDSNPNIMYLDYRDINPGVAVVYDSTKKCIYLKKLMDMEGTAIYNNIAGAMSGTMSARLGGKFETGGTIADVLYQSREEMKNSPNETDDAFEHRKATIIKIGDSQNTLNTQEDSLKYEDYARLAALATNIASVFMDPVSGGVAGVAASTADFTADAADKSVSWLDAAKNYAVNLGLDVVGLIPSMEFLKIGRQIKTSANLIGKAMAIYGVGMGLKNSENYINAIKEIGNGNITRENVKQAGQAIMLLATAIKTGKGAIQKRKAAKVAAQQQRIGLTVVDKEGTKYDLDINGALADEIRAAKGNKKQLQEIFDTKIKPQDKRLQNGEFKIDTKLGMIPGKMSLKNSEGKWFKGEEGKLYLSPFRRNLKPNTWNPITRQELELRDGRWYRKQGDASVEDRELISIDGNNTTVQPQPKNTTPSSPQQIQNYFEGVTGKISAKNKGKFTKTPTDPKTLAAIEERGIKALNTQLERIKTKSFFKQNPNDPNIPAGFDPNTSTGLQELKNLLQGNKAIRIQLQGDPNVYYWKPKASTKLDELERNLSLIAKAGGKIQMFKIGGTQRQSVSGVNIKPKSEWEPTVGALTWDAIIKHLEENKEYYKTVNQMQDEHSGIRNEALRGGWVPEGNAYISNSIGNYQNKYQEQGYNKVAIAPNYKARYSFNGPEKRNGIDAPELWTSDNAYASITNDRHLLGWSGQYTESQIYSKNEQLAKYGLELYEDPNTHYYKIRPIGSNDPNFGDAPTSPLTTEQPRGQEITEPGSNKHPKDSDKKGLGINLKSKIEENVPMLMDYLRMKYLNSRNLKNAELSKKAIVPDYKSPFVVHKLVYGNLAAKNAAEQEAAALYNKVARTPLSSNADQQQAALMEAALKGSALRQQGNTADNTQYRKTQEADWDQEKANAYNSYQTAQANNTEALQAETKKNAIDTAVNAEITNNTDTFLKTLVADAQNKINQKKKLTLASNLKDIETLAITNPKALGINLTNDEQLALKMVSSGEILPSDLQEPYKSAYKSATAKVNFAKSTFLRNEYDLSESPYGKEIEEGLNQMIPFITESTEEKQNSNGIQDVITSQMTPSSSLQQEQKKPEFFKKGGKTDSDEVKITVAKIKEKIKDADRLQQSILKKNDSLDKQIANLFKQVNSNKPITIKLKY